MVAPIRALTLTLTLMHKRSAPGEKCLDPTTALVYPNNNNVCDHHRAQVPWYLYISDSWGWTEDAVGGKIYMHEHLHTHIHTCMHTHSRAYARLYLCVIGFTLSLEVNTIRHTPY